MFKYLKLLIRRVLPAPFFSMLRSIPYFFIEFLQPNVRTQRGIPVPPLWKMFDGPRNKAVFLRNSEEVLGIYKTWGALKPESRLLDIGSGLGRKTLSLPNFIGREGRYVGIDIVREGVDWCNRYIAPKSPNFVFLHLNVFNGRYNPKGTVKAQDYVFPFVESSFDLVTAWSVFTHMLPSDVKNYLKETSRMLKPNGRCIFSFYIMNEKSIDAVKRGIASERIDYEIEDSLFTDSKTLPEDLTAYRETSIRTMYAAVGLRVEKILYGSWTGDEAPRNFPMTNYQDIVIAARA